LGLPDIFHPGGAGWIEFAAGTDIILGAVGGSHRPRAGVAGRSCLYRNLFVVCAHVTPASSSPRQPGLRRPRHAWGGRVNEPSMDEFANAAHNMAALPATIALYRALVRKGLMPRDEAMQILLDEAIANAIQTEALMQEPGVSKKTIEINRQCEEILKFIAEHL